MEKSSLYMKKTDAKLTQYNAKLAKMKSKTAEIQADMTVEYLDQVENLEKKRDEFMKKQSQLKTASEHGWEDIKTGIEEAWTELEDAFDKADVFIIKKMVRDNSNEYFNKINRFKL